MDIRDSLKQFSCAFQRAVRLEMDAMRERLGPFEVGLDSMVPADIEEGGRYRYYAFRVVTPSDKLVVNGECSLLHDGSEKLVTIMRIEGDRIVLRCAYDIPGGAVSYVLVIYPWFLYERLLTVLDSLVDDPSFNTESALRLFGKIQPVFMGDVCLENGALNESQNQAVNLCCTSNLAFVWGPPGTGKTTTLGYIVTGLLARDKRVLVTSTTNAAVDQVLAKLSRLEEARDFFEKGKIVRVGQTDAETFGAGLYEVLESQNQTAKAQLRVLGEKRRLAQSRVQVCQTMLDALAKSQAPCQLDMFAPVNPSVLSVLDLQDVFGGALVKRISGADRAVQQRSIERRCRRLSRCAELCAELVAKIRKELNSREKSVVRHAGVVLSTMTNTYISQLLADEQFDVVVVEEAGMAVLPTVFYCAGLAKETVIAVGDPRQLPPIVQSSDRYARQAMGRSIFDVTVPEPHLSDVVVMLNTQYRMHPVIGSLVSELFYQGRLKNAEETVATQYIAEKNPFPDAPLVVLDTQGRTRCETVEGSYSRSNEISARTCVQLAVDAVVDGVESVAIITPYARQARLITSLLNEQTLPAGVVECSTVHRFQGNERDVVIFDAVDTAPMKPGVLLADTSKGSSAPNIINVSISRARGKLILVADVSYFRRQAPNTVLVETINEAAEAGRVCDAFYGH